jgi:hypothetical protein
MMRIDDAVPQTEEIAQRTNHARMRGIVPGHFQQALPQSGPGHPDMRDLARTFDVGQNAALPGMNNPEIGVPARPIP